MPPRGAARSSCGEPTDCTKSGPVQSPRAAAAVPARHRAPSSPPVPHPVPMPRSTSLARQGSVASDKRPTHRQRSLPRPLAAPSPTRPPLPRRSVSSIIAAAPQRGSPASTGTPSVLTAAPTAAATGATSGARRAPEDSRSPARPPLTTGASSRGCLTLSRQATGAARVRAESDETAPERVAAVPAAPRPAKRSSSLPVHRGREALPQRGASTPPAASQRMSYTMSLCYRSHTQDCAVAPPYTSGFLCQSLSPGGLCLLLLASCTLSSSR